MITVSPEDIEKAREVAGHTQTAAAEAVGATLRAWQYWEKGERNMSPALFEYYLLRTNQHPHYILQKRKKNA